MFDSQLISEYKTPAGTSLQRHLLTIINKQLDYLSHTRVLATTMKSAAKHIKSAISNVSIETPDEDVSNAFQADYGEREITLTAISPGKNTTENRY